MPRPISPVIPGKKFTEVVYAKDQPQYKPLPAMRGEDGTILTRWKFNWAERLVLLWHGDLYLWVVTFNKPLQPLRMQVGRPVQP